MRNYCVLRCRRQMICYACLLPANKNNSAKLWLSLLLRPIVVPEISGLSPKKTMETRFFAPGGLVANLDFVESIFGNAGDPFLPDNDAALDIDQWTGHTGCIILAPHLVGCRKQAHRPAPLPRGYRASAQRRHVLAKLRTISTTRVNRLNSSAAICRALLSR